MYYICNSKFKCFLSERKHILDAFIEKNVSKRTYSQAFVWRNPLGGDACKHCFAADGLTQIRGRILIPQ